MSFKTFVQRVSVEMAPIWARTSTKGNQSLNEVVNFYWLYDFSQRTFFKLQFKREQRTGGKKIHLLKTFRPKKWKQLLRRIEIETESNFCFKKVPFFFCSIPTLTNFGTWLQQQQQLKQLSCLPFFQERGVTFCRHDIGSFAVTTTTSVPLVRINLFLGLSN